MRLFRVAYVVNVFPKLSETFIANEVAELQRRGVQVRVLSLLPRPTSIEHALIQDAGLEEITSWNPPDFPSILSQFRPHLVHAHFATEPAAAARTLAADLGCPFTFTAHGYDIRRKPPSDFAARANAARAVITVSEANARHITATFGVPSAHIRVIPCGIDTELFKPFAAPKGENPNDEPPLIVCVARLVKVKRHALLLEVCERLRRRGVKFRCVIVGDGPCRSELEALRAELRLEELVEFVGAATQEQVLIWWQRASVAVLTSEDEGMPVCLMEAGACGLPTVATAVGGIPELIEPEVTGLLAPPGAADALAAHLERLLQNPQIAATMGAAARWRVQNHFSLARQVDHLLAVWNKFIDEGGCGNASPG